MAERLDYDFTATQVAIDRVHKELRDFRVTLDRFRDSYVKASQLWGGDASTNAAADAARIDNFGTDTATIVKVFLDRYTEHLDVSQDTERRLANQFLA